MGVKEAAPRSREINHLSLDERLGQGRTARDRTPPSSHAGWSPAADRPDPVSLLEEQDRTREPDLVPVRHGRMMVSPFTFYRGADRIMAADLAGTPVAGLSRLLRTLRRPERAELQGVRQGSPVRSPRSGRRCLSPMARPPTGPPGPSVSGSSGPEAALTAQVSYEEGS